MEIQWGENFIVIDKTVAMILALIPLLIVMNTPKFWDVVNKFTDRARKKLAQKYPGHYGRHREV